MVTSAILICFSIVDTPFGEKNYNWVLTIPDK